MTNTLGLGKYRDLLLAILLFIVLDLGILFFNVFASIQLERDASRINSAGELRMLTQQLTKALLTLQVERRDELPIQTSMAQLSQGRQGFNSSLQTLHDSLLGEFEFSLFGIDAGGLRDTVARVEREWRPLDESIEPLLRPVSEPGLDDVEIAVNKAVARNIKLAGLSDDVATAVETAANRKTTRMRQIQVTAIVLALLNFVYIVFKFLRRLNASDRQAELARREVDDILTTVSEGLLLVHADGRVGGQFSQSVHTLLGRTVQPGQDFRVLLTQALGAERAAEAADFMSLLFDPKVKPALLEQVNPLRMVPVQAGTDNPATERYLTFAVRQVREGGRIKELLVTVFDVTEKVRLERDLAASQEAARGDVEDLLRSLENEPSLLLEFLAAAREHLAGINQGLRDVGRRPGAGSQLLGQAARTLHGIKGEAGAFGLSALSRQIHQMEGVMAPLLKRCDITGEELIPLAVELAQVLEQIERLHRVTERVGRLSAGSGSASPGQRQAELVGQLSRLTDSVARDLKKNARFVLQGMPPALSPEVFQTLGTVLPQMIRNAVVHGIETPEERERMGKSPVGEVRLAVDREADGAIVVTVSDDGGGIALAQLRAQAAARGDARSGSSDRELMNMIFDPDVSTAAEVSEHAGRGVGLALVREKLVAAGARLRVSTAPGKYTRFTLKFGGAA
ncbi:MAG: ATP-binding protein [Hylemonella sp.]|uniref:ATP-binding protein n=1 Tax=Hylemonella sp. TaxID=2066020 RepID=UPI00391BC4FC